MCFGGSGARDIRKGRDRALQQLEKSYEGPIRGLQIAPEFYKLLSSPELKNTPLGRSLDLQNQILGEVSAGLGGQAFGRTKGRPGAGSLPPDMVSAIGENLTMQNAANGTGGSPANAIRAAMRFSGASEDILSQRLNNAQRALEQIGGASIMPSASQFLQVGANKASQAANLEMQAGEQIYNAHQAHQNQLWGAVGTLGGMAAAPFTGGASLGGMGMLSGLFGGGAQSSGRPGAQSGFYTGGSYGNGGFQNTSRNSPFGFDYQGANDQQFWNYYSPFLTGGGF